MSFRKLALLFSLTILCLAQGDWQTSTEIGSIDMQGLTGAKRAMALKIARTEPCSCGCDLKIAECREKDHTCQYSKKLALAVVKEVVEGRTEADIRTDLKRVAAEPAPVLDPPVRLSIGSAPVRGPLSARVTVTEFSDFQCPYCSEAVAQTKALMRQFPRDVRLVFKQFPLEDHSQAQFAAEAALAAQAQGKFWEMHDMIYAGSRVSRTIIMGYATKLGLDMKQFTLEMNVHKYAARVHAEEKEGEEAGVGGTPTFFINGKKYNEVFTAEKVAPLVKAELKK